MILFKLSDFEYECKYNEHVLFTLCSETIVNSRNKDYNRWFPYIEISYYHQKIHVEAFNENSRGSKTPEEAFEKGLKWFKYNICNVGRN